MCGCDWGGGESKHTAAFWKPGLVQVLLWQIGATVQLGMKGCSGLVSEQCCHLLADVSQMYAWHMLTWAGGMPVNKHSYSGSERCCRLSAAAMQWASRCHACCN
jgi:hypothetical protein